MGYKTQGRVPVPRDRVLSPREEQLELVVRYTMSWLEEIGAIHVSDNGTRQSCVVEQIDDKDTAILDVACEKALAGKMSPAVFEEMRRVVGDFNFRELIGG